MTRACMLGHPAAGHVNPTLPVIAALAQRGHSITYFATPPFEERIRHAGAAFESYGEHAMFERELARGGMLGGMAGLVQTVEEILPDVLTRVRALGSDYLLLEAHSLCGNLVAQSTGLPAITLCSMFAMNEQLITAPHLMQHLYGEALPDVVLDGLLGFTRYAATARRLAAAHGVLCPDIVNYLGNRQPLNIVLTSREFQVGADAFDDSYRFVGMAPPALPPQDDDVLRTLDGRPLIYVSMGTMYNDEAGLYAACFEAFGRSPYQVVLSIGRRVARSSLPPPPPNFIVREHVPQPAVLARAAVFITHGGINSAHEAMLEGVPLVVLPLAADHHVVARRVAEVGAGLVLDRTRVTPGALRELTARVLDDPSFAGRSRGIGATLRAAGGAARAAKEIEVFLGARC